MREITKVLRRSRGRPQIRPDSETLLLIFEAAREEFSARGFAGTSMNAVAQRAGISTKTLYRLIPTKAELFRSIVADRIGRFMLAFDGEALDRLPLAEGLERMMRAYGELTLGADTVAITHLVLSECQRFPELAATFYEVAILQTSEAMAAWLARQCARGLIKLDDPNLAAGMLRGMMTMEPQRAIMLRQRATPAAAELADRAKYCARLFLDGCGMAHR